MAEQPQYSPRTATISRNFQEAKHSLPEDPTSGPPNKKQRAEPEPEYGVVANLLVGNNRISARRQREWLDRSAQWPGLPHEQWRPRRVLGAGSYAICGLWEYIGTNPRPENVPRHVVVKQDAIHHESLRRESKFLRAIQDACDTEHIVKLYRSYYRERGSGTSIADPWPYKPGGGYDRTREVAKIYLEYCEKGDLENVLGKFRGSIPEEQVWRVLECLASAMMVLERGTENPQGASWDKPIAHFDIKPTNILIHCHNKTHQRLEAFKLADFGLALQVPRDIADPVWIAEVRWRGTPRWLPPEQGYSGETHYGSTLGKGDRISTPTNIWALGAVMYYIMTGGGFIQSYRQDPNSVISMKQESFVTTTPLIPEMGKGIESFATYGYDLRRLPYSKYLVQLIFACLAHNPNNRLRARDVVRHAREALGSYDTMNMESNNSDPVNFAGANLENVRPPEWPGFTRDEISPAESEAYVSLPWARAPTIGHDDWAVSPEIGTQPLVFDKNLILGARHQVWKRELEATPRPLPLLQVEETTPKEPGVTGRIRKPPLPPVAVLVSPQAALRPSGFQTPQAPSWSPITAVEPRQQPLRPPVVHTPRPQLFSPITPRPPIQPAVPKPAPPPPVAGRPLRRNPDRVKRYRPTGPQPAFPQPLVPQPVVPQPAVPQPAVPQPAAPQPAAPQPAAPEPPPRRPAHRRRARNLRRGARR